MSCSVSRSSGAGSWWSEQRPGRGVQFAVDAAVRSGVIDHLGQLGHGDVLGHPAAERGPGPAGHPVLAQVPGQGADPGPRAAAGCRAVAGGAAVAREVESVPRRQNHVRIERVRLAHWVRGVERDGAEQVRVPAVRTWPKKVP